MPYCPETRMHSDDAHTILEHRRGFSKASQRAAEDTLDYFAKKYREQERHLNAAEESHKP